MAFYELDEVFGYQDANNMKKLWASATAPDSPGEGEVWLDISGTLPQLKRYSSSAWETIGDVNAQDILDKIKTVDGAGSGLDADTVDGLESASFIRSDTADSFSGALTSTVSNGVALKFDDGDSMITVHDGYGNFNIKSGVDENHEVINSNGASHLEFSETGRITAAVSTKTIGETFTDDNYVSVTTTGVDIDASQFRVMQSSSEKLKVGTDGKIYEGSDKLEDKYIMREDFIFDKKITTGYLPRAINDPLTVINVSGRGAAQVCFGSGATDDSPIKYIYNCTVWVDGTEVMNGPLTMGNTLMFHFNTSFRLDAQQSGTLAKCLVSYCNN